MTPRSALALAGLSVVLGGFGAPPARAQAVDAEMEDAPIVAEEFDASKCPKDVEDDADTTTVVGAPPVNPVNWVEFDVAGTFVESQATVHALLAPIMNSHRSLTPTSRDEIAKRAAEYGYHLVGLGTRDEPAGRRAIVNLAPMPRLRVINVDMNQSWFSSLRPDDVRRRMTARVGSYLPWTPFDRRCRLYKETTAIRELLRDEGYFEASVTLKPRLKTDAAVALDVEINLGPEYTVDVDRMVIENADQLAAGIDEIRDRFRHRGTCLLGDYGCIGSPRFRRTQFQEDTQAVTALFHSRGYPEARVRVVNDVEPDPTNKTVWFKLSIDQRRRLDVVFEGFDPNSVSLANLRKQLTFDDATSAGDIEANDSAAALTAYLQGRGFFEAKVSWSRERFDVFDRIVYRIEQGRSRAVKRVDIEGNAALTDGEVATVMGTRAARASLFGATTAVTSDLLSGDVDRIVDLYRRKGYRKARVRVTAAPDPVALDSAALTASMVAADKGDGLYVRFTVTEGVPTTISYISIVLGTAGDEPKTVEDQRVCLQVLGDLAELYGHKELAHPTTQHRCTAVGENLLFAEEDAALTADQLRNRLFTAGRPRASVTYAPKVINDTTVAAIYTLENLQELTFGKIVIRGNFRTRDAIIYEQLGIAEGEPLTQDRIAEGARNLRNMGLFESVNVTMPDLDSTSSGSVNAIFDITERYEAGMLVGVEGGYSSFNGLFVRLVPTFPNIDGRGISLDFSATVGVSASQALFDGQFELRQLSAESTLRIPKWLSPWNSFDTELTAFHRRQDTPRFGLLRTTGTTLQFTHTKESPRVGMSAAHAWTLGAKYDFRSRSRNIDTIRPIGADADEPQAPVTTRTGLIGVSFGWEQRTDRTGILQPLAPEAGFRFDASAALASPYFLGQNWFVKLSIAGSKFYTPTSRVLLRADFRYDQGIPLFGETLLPEVERFFAGGDSTVRGYEDDRLETEVIVVDVPPLDNVQQIRVLPAGGDIRVLGSLDAQVRIYKYLASALFVDGGLITNQWDTVESQDIRPSVGIAVARIVTAFGSIAVERAIPLRPQLGDNPRGRWHVSFAARAQF